MTAETLRRTPLFQSQQALGGRFVDFHGWELPVQFESILKEHQAVRTQAGLFDVSHMGQVWIRGPQALDFLQKVNSNDISRAAPGKGVYSHLPTPTGGVVDDVIVFGVEARRYLVVVNAATAEGDVAWLAEHAAGFDVEVEDASGRYAMLALQGPKSPAIADKVAEGSSELKRFGIRELRLFGESAWVCRTGYTGEDGFEFIVPVEVATRLFDTLIAQGRPVGMVPCGLGARDTLRLEVGYLLYGQDIDRDHSPLEAGCGWVVKLDKPDFIGKEALAAQKAGGLKRRLSGFRLKGPGVPRPGAEVFHDGARIAVLTSATFSPSLKAGIGVGYAEPPSEPGAAVEIALRGRRVAAEAVSVPFYRPG